MMTARQYLEGVREAVRTQNSLDRRLEIARSKMDGVSGVDYNRMAMPGNPNASDGCVPSMVLAYQGIVEELETQQAFASMLVSQAFGMLEHMRDDGCPGVCCDILEMTYIWDMSTKDIAQYVGKSTRRVKQLRSDTLEVSDGYVPLDAA